MNLKQILKNVLSNEEIPDLIRSFDIVGDIAILIIPASLEKREHVIAQAVLESNQRIKVVVKRDGNYEGEFRTISLKVLAGENRKKTIVTEFGVRLQLNLEKVYFSIRSGAERRRVASLVEDGEDVLVLFSGIAPYPLILAKFSGAMSITGIEKNPTAHRYALTNLQLNKRLKNITLLQGDAQRLLHDFAKQQRHFDRILMPLPTAGAPFLSKAIQILKPSGRLHYYDMQKTDFFDNSRQKVIDSATCLERKVAESTIVKCGHCGPRTYRICIDCTIS